jgi:NarL family two-component system response regulator LiaR
MATVVAGRFEDLVTIGLSALIEEDPHLELVAQDIPMSELESAVEEHSPAVVLLNFAALQGPADVLVLHRRFPESRILVLGHRPTTAECTQMLSFGATGCLSKETEASDIVSAIKLASRGMHVLPRSAAAGGGVDRLGPEGAELTAREAEVLELLQDGCTNSEIAEQLSIGIETVRTHARSVYRKLRVPSRRELARMAQRDAVVVDEKRRPVAAT